MESAFVSPVVAAVSARSTNIGLTLIEHFFVLIVIKDVNFAIAFSTQHVRHHTPPFKEFY
jgi:hypothetical protein